MTPTSRSPLPRTPACLLIAGLLALPGCVTEYELEPGVMSFEVTFAASDPDQPTGTAEAPLAYVAGAACNPDCPDGQTCVNQQCVHRMTLDIRAIGTNGQPFPYRGPVNLRVTPGQLVSEAPVQFMDNGVLEGVTVDLMQGLGPTHVWIEADGFVPSGAAYGQCNDGIDNDNDGYLDVADPDCEGTEDDLEAPASYATGVSPTIYFDNPRLRDIQFSASLRTSPLVGEQVRVSAGNLFVTNVVANGFYVLDIEDNTPERRFASMFIFTYSKPQGIEYRDYLCGFSGAVQEHVGMTQMVFPSFEKYYPGNPLCQGFQGLNPDSAYEPFVWDVTDDLVVEDPKDSSNYLPNVYANSQHLESLEGNLVRFSNVAVSERFIACDRNGNGTIDSGTDEFTCRNDCQDEYLCSDLEGYFEYNQYAGVVDGKKKIWGSTVLVDFRPLDIDFIGGPDLNGRCEVATTEQGFIEYTCPPLTLEHMTGSLRHIYLCGDFSSEDRCDLQFWVLDPRFPRDVKVVE